MNQLGIPKQMFVSCESQLRVGSALGDALSRSSSTIWLAISDIWSAI